MIKGSEDSTTTTVPANITMYPNPTNGEFHIEGVERGEIMQIYDYAGRLIKTVVADNTSILTDISNQPNGLYLIRIIGTDGTLISQKKLVKQW